MNTTTHPVWILQAFDRAGNIIGTITKHPNLPVVRKGDPGAFALLDTRDLDNPDNVFAMADYSGPPPCPKCGPFHKDADNHPVPCPRDLGDTLRAIGARLRKQDNRCTANPMYCVQIKIRENGFDTGYTDNKCWHHPAAGVTVYDDDPDFVHRVMDAEKAAADEWDISGYRDRWETVMVAMTEKGCEQYLELNGHNDRRRAHRGEIRIYVDSWNRCPEMLDIRDFLMAAACDSQLSFPRCFASGSFVTSMVAG